MAVEWKCAGCGSIYPDRAGSCDCPTSVLFYMEEGKMLHDIKLDRFSGADMSHFGWIVLGQLAKGSVWDGDLVCKSGRDELVKHGLAQRKRQDAQGLMVNELTPAGLQIAASLSDAGHA